MKPGPWERRFSATKKLDGDPEVGRDGQAYVKEELNKRRKERKEASLVKVLLKEHKHHGRS